jgi:adenosylcobinamide kinase/adenosylcobinamide-phosphate guanylyltransferase
MAKIIFITGGSRSGKSVHALDIADSISGPRAYIATCPALDEEMEERIKKHREARQSSAWQTIEEAFDIAGALREAANCRVILVDCLTLWLNNLMYDAAERGRDVTEDDVVEYCEEIVEACAGIAGTVIFVTNEVGMGIVPDNLLSRTYRDLAGRCNQIIADAADCVIFMISGIPVCIKGAL